MLPLETSRICGVCEEFFCALWFRLGIAVERQTSGRAIGLDNPSTNTAESQPPGFMSSDTLHLEAIGHTTIFWMARCYLGPYRMH